MAHYYLKTEKGVEPYHYVPMASRPDELRPTRITDVKKLWKDKKFVVPSVTGIIDVLDKKALTNWKIDQHLKVAYKDDGNAPFEERSEEDYIKEIKRLTELQMEVAPSAGSDFHKLMEQFLLCKLPDNDPSYNLCQSVQLAILDNTQQTVESGMWAAKPEQNFVSNLGYGGQVDLTLADQWVIDYKTKQTKDKFKPGKMAYDDHQMQLSAYREGLGLPNARAANVFICLEDGQIDFHEHKEEELDKGWEMFLAALKIWQLQNGWEDRLA